MELHPNGVTFRMRVPTGRNDRHSPVTGFPCNSEDIVLIRRAAVAAALAAGLAIAGSPAAAHASSNAIQAGTRAYLVITAPNDTAGAKSAVVSNGGTVFASYDAIGVIVAHSTPT